MYSLEKALDDHELLVLRVIGEWWELELTGADKPACIKELNKALGRLDMSAEIDYLGPEEANALEDLIQSGGKVPVASFERSHGKLRQMGPGRLEREEPWLDPISPTESLWYRGFLYRGFDESESAELAEFYYLPEELYDQFPQPQKQPVKTKVIRETVQEAKPVQESAPPPVTKTIQAAKAPKAFEAASTDTVDDLTTILALSQNFPLKESALDWLDPYLLQAEPDRRNLLVTLAVERGLLRQSEDGFRPAKAAVSWLKMSREGQLRELVEAWSSSNWNDLCHVPSLACEGSGWKNDPILARAALLEAIPQSGDWFRPAELISQIKENTPDFQRPDGNYKTWYIRDRLTGTYLSDFEHWDQVEGRLLHFLIQGPLHWLGMTDLALKDEQPLCRLTPRALAWLKNTPPAANEVAVPIVVQDDASLLIPFNGNRYHRFQATRITEPSPVQPGQPYHYHFTPQSLQLATEQGIEPERLLQFLAEASGRPIPASTKRAIERWAENGIEARLEHVVVLRVRQADILEKLRANSRTRPYLGEFLGDLAVIVRSGDWPKLRQAAAQLGLLMESIETDDEG
jgi:hypothetical protein